jgi:hypothetical protein
MFAVTAPESKIIEEQTQQTQRPYACVRAGAADGDGGEFGREVGIGCHPAG